MDVKPSEKSALPRPISLPSRTPRPSRSRCTVLFAAGFILTYMLLSLNPRSITCRFPRPTATSARTSSNATTVPLEAHIMSKCPDARDCLHDLILPVMANVSSKVDFQMSYIGTVTNHDDGVACMHGQTECLGNIVELCAADAYPEPKLYLGFTNCLSQRYRDIPDEDLLKDCAAEFGLDFEVLNECMSRDDGAYAMGMLRDSVTRSKDAGVRYSCTVRLNEKVWCIRDGGKWKDCEGGSSPEDLIQEINDLYKK